MATFVKVATASDVPPGSGIVTTANDKEYAVFNVNGAFHVIDNTCMHRAGRWERESWRAMSSPAPGTPGSTM